MQELRVTFSAGARILRVRLLMWGSLLIWGLGGLWMAYLTYDHMSLPADQGGGIAPHGERLAWGITIALLALAFPLGMHVFGRCYVSRIVADKSRTLNYYETIGWLRPTRWTLTEDVQGEVVHHAGHTRGFYDPVSGLAGMEVRAPYRSVHSSRRRLPFIVDDQGIDFDWLHAEILRAADDQLERLPSDPELSPDNPRTES